ncbi:MAG: hypothetical protein E7384_05340 [Ruminococcaceae bacterium]|nr:hypothetical protein [Oscillospiraceae bacterium]
MDAELENKIKEIGSALGIEKMPDNIGDMLSAFLGSDDSSECGCENEESTSCEKQENISGFPSNLLGNGMDIMRIITGVKAAQHQNENDYKIIFLKNLKPLLKNNRQSRVDKCIKFLCFAKIVEMYGQNG